MRTLYTRALRKMGLVTRSGLDELQTKVADGLVERLAERARVYLD